MNKEQKKPQEDCSYVTTTEHRGNPCKKEEKLQSQEDWEKEWDKEFYEGLFSCNESDGEYSDASIIVKHWIHANFIAKRDLRKLLEGKKTHISLYEYSGNPSYRACRRETIDDIKAEIEKL